MSDIHPTSRPARPANARATPTTKPATTQTKDFNEDTKRRTNPCGGCGCRCLAQANFHTICRSAVFGPGPGGITTSPPRPHPLRTPGRRLLGWCTPSIELSAPFGLPGHRLPFPFRFNHWARLVPFSPSTNGHLGPGVLGRLLIFQTIYCNDY